METVGIPLLHTCIRTPEVPRLILNKTWVKKESPAQKYFQDFVNQITKAFIHKLLDKLSSDIHRPTLLRVNEDSKRLGAAIDVQIF